MAEYDLTVQLTATLKQYTEQVQDDIDRDAERCAKGAQKDLKSTSPQFTGGYAKNWKVKSEKVYTRGSKQFTVYNDKKYQLTHLLERAHAGPYGKGTVAGHPHIAPVEEKWTEEFVKRCEEACKR